MQIISAVLKTLPTYEIDASTNDVFKLTLHTYVMEQRPSHIIRKRNQHIHVAVVSEVVAQHRAK